MSRLGARNRKLLHIKLRVVLEELQKYMADVNLVQLGRDLLGLKERDNEQEESIRREPASIGVVESPHLQHLLEHQNQRFNQRVFFQVLLYERHALQSVVRISHLSDVNLDRLVENLWELKFALARQIEEGLQGRFFLVRRVQQAL